MDLPRTLHNNSWRSPGKLDQDDGSKSTGLCLIVLFCLAQTSQYCDTAVITTSWSSRKASEANSKVHPLWDTALRTISRSPRSSSHVPSHEFSVEGRGALAFITTNGSDTLCLVLTLGLGALIQHTVISATPLERYTETATLRNNLPSTAAAAAAAAAATAATAADAALLNRSRQKLLANLSAMPQRCAL